MGENIFTQEEWERIRHFLREYGRARDFTESEHGELEELILVRESRVALCSESLELFMIVYLTHYLKKDFAPFHREMCDLMRFEGFQFFFPICFREAAKTSLARGKALQWILFAQKKNMHWIGHDLSKAQKNVMAIANELLGNKKIIFDLGKVLMGSSRRDDEKKQNTLTKFTTSAGVSMSAGTTQKSTRGDLESANRPDAYFIDDIENTKTKASRVITQSIINFLGELLSGADASANFIILANRISKIGVVNFLENMAERMPNIFRIYEKKLIENGKLVWDAAWVMTDEEAREWNDSHDKSEWKKSVETEKRKLKEVGFAQELMNEPAGTGDMFHEENFNGFAISDSEKIKRNMEVGIIIDPSFSTRDTSDFCPIIAMGREQWGSGMSGVDGRPLVISRYYLLDGSAEKYLPEKSIEIAINMAFGWISRGYRVSFISCEQVSINRDQQDFVKNLEREMKRRGLFISLKRSKPNAKKEQRIVDACQPVLSTGRFFVRCDDAENEFWFEMKDQFLKFPLHAHDDIPDVVAQGIHEFEKKGVGEKAAQSKVNEYFTEADGVKEKENPLENWNISESTGSLLGSLLRPHNIARATQSKVDDYWN